MHKKELVRKLEKFIISSEKGEGGSVFLGQISFAKFLVHYFNQLAIPNDEKYDFWTIEHHLPQLMVDAFEQLRTGMDKATLTFRKIYEIETGHEVPNIVDIGASNVLHRASAVQTTLGFMMREVAGQDWVEDKIDAYCNAQQYVLQQTFDKFLRLVYCRGLGEIIANCKKSGMSGKFNQTELRTFVTAGRIMFTFARRINRKKDSYYRKNGEIYCNEWNVSFVGEQSDPLCLGSGLQSMYSDLRKAMEMIEDVIDNWPSESKKQIKVFKPDLKVALL